MSLEFTNCRYHKPHILPTSKEKMSAKALERITYPKYHWSSDASDDFSNTMVAVGFKRASVASSSKENKSFVRCVKDGE